MSDIRESQKGHSAGVSVNQVRTLKAQRCRQREDDDDLHRDLAGYDRMCAGWLVCNVGATVRGRQLQRHCV